MAELCENRYFCIIDTATTEINTEWIVGSVSCVEGTGEADRRPRLRGHLARLERRPAGVYERGPPIRRSLLRPARLGDGQRQRDAGLGHRPARGINGKPVDFEYVRMD